MRQAISSNVLAMRRLVGADAAGCGRLATKGSPLGARLAVCIRNAPSKGTATRLTIAPFSNSARLHSGESSALLHHLDATTTVAPNPTSSDLAAANETMDAQMDSPEVIKAAIATIKAAAAHGSIPAIARVGRWYLLGICGCKKDVRAGIQLLHAAAVQGNTDGQFWLGKFFSGAEAYMVGQDAETGTAAQAPGAREETDPAKKAALAKAVIAEIRAMRKIAKENKVRRVQGLPPLPLKPAATTAAGASSPADDSAASASEGDDYSRVALATNKALAHRWFMQAASQDHADAQVALGNLMMADGDAKQAIWWYEVAAQVSHHSLPGTLSTPPAGGRLAAAEAVVLAVPTPEAAAAPEEAELLAPAAPNASGALPHPDALYNLGMAYWDGIHGVVPKDRLRAAAYFKRAADLFDPSALFWLGYSHHNGDKEAGIPRDSRSAMRYLELAAGSGHPGAAHYLARLYRNGDKKRLGLSPNARKSEHFLRMAADAGHAEAIFELADAYFHGYGNSSDAGSNTTITSGSATGIVVERDYARALGLYEKAASLGHVKSMLSAGAMHYHGLGQAKAGARDFAKALQYYTEAGERGSAQGWENVAAMYALGEGVPVNESAARYIRTRVIPQMLEQQAANGGVDGDDDGGVLPADDDDEEEAASGGGGGGCGKPTCKSGGCGSKKQAAASAADAPAEGASGTHGCGGNGACGGTGACKSKQADNAAPAAEASAASAGTTNSSESAGDGSSGDFEIKTTLYRASDPAVQSPTTKQGSGDTPEDPIVLDLTSKASQQVLEQLLKR